MCTHAAVLVRDVADLGEGIERAGVHVPGLRADDRRSLAAREERGGERGGPHRALRVGLDDFES